MTLVLSGTGVTDGIASGEIHLLSAGELELPEYHLEADSVEQEIERLQRAAGRCERLLEDMVGRLRTHARDPAVDLLEAHRLMVRDELLLGETGRRIRQEQINAEWALDRQAMALRRQFQRMEDDYLAQRIEDLDQVVRLIQRELAEQPAPLLDEQVPHRLDRTIILAEQLSPAELAMLHERQVAGLITEHGGIWAHSAIVARALGIPMVVAVHRAARLLEEGEPVILDGHYGVVLATRDSGLHSHYQEKLLASRRKKEDLVRHLEQPSQTRDGVSFHLFGNAEQAAELQRCVETRAEGIGLMRTEFLFTRQQFSDEDTQFAAFREAVDILGGRSLTIRTLDAGGDKLPPELIRVQGPNPALGLRGLRLSLAMRTQFMTQLRAILRASVHGPVRVLLPMLNDAGEVREARALISQAREELRARDIHPDPDLPVGGMIETPAAALGVDHLAGELDFLSIGTNDLIQYVLAVDRQDELVSHLYQPSHPAILELIRRIVAAAGRLDRPVEVCGEMAGDVAYVRLLLGLGVTRFSVPPGQLAAVKARLRTSHARRCREIVDDWLDGGARDRTGEQLLERLDEKG